VGSVGPDYCASCLSWRLHVQLFDDRPVCSWNTIFPFFVIGIMAVDENGNSADEGSIDPNCPIFDPVNFTFPQASWYDARRAVSVL